MPVFTFVLFLTLSLTSKSIPEAKKTFLVETIDSAKKGNNYINGSSQDILESIFILITLKLL
jgi:hypothetical protein